MTEVLAQTTPLAAESVHMDPHAAFEDHVRQVRAQGDPLDISGLRFSSVARRGAFVGAAVTTFGVGAELPLGILVGGLTIGYDMYRVSSSIETIEANVRDDTQRAVGEKYELYRARPSLRRQPRDVDMVWWGPHPDAEHPEDLPSHLTKIALMARDSGIRNIVVRDELVQTLYHEKPAPKPTTSGRNWLLRTKFMQLSGGIKDDQVHVASPDAWLQMSADAAEIPTESVLAGLLEKLESFRPEHSLVKASRGTSNAELRRQSMTGIARQLMMPKLTGRTKQKQDIHSPNPAPFEPRKPYAGWLGEGESVTLTIDGNFSEETTIARILGVTEERLAKLIAHPETNYSDAEDALVLSIYRQLVLSSPPKVEVSARGMAVDISEKTWPLAPERTMYQESEYKKPGEGQRATSKAPRIFQRLAAGILVAATTAIGLSTAYGAIDNHYQHDRTAIERQIGNQEGAAADLENIGADSGIVTSRLASESPSFRYWQAFSNIRRDYSKFMGKQPAPGNGSGTFEAGSGIGNTMPFGDMGVGNVTDGMPWPNTLQWRVEPHSMSADGYWYTQTSSQLTADHRMKEDNNLAPYMYWTPESQYIPGRLLPSRPSDSQLAQPNIEVAPAAGFNEGRNREYIKGEGKFAYTEIPVLDGTAPIAALYYPAESSTPVRLNIMETSNGLYALTYSSNVAPDNGTLVYWLAPEKSSLVRATGTFKENGTLQYDRDIVLNTWDRMVPKLSNITNPEQRAVDVAYWERTKWKYFLNPLGIVEMENDTSFNNFEFDVIKAKRADCNIANTNVVLQDSKLNAAFGYGGVAGQGSNFGLWAHSAHEWAVDRSGRIIDGTPYRMGPGQAAFFDAVNQNEDNVPYKNSLDLPFVIAGLALLGGVGVLGARYPVRATYRAGKNGLAGHYERTLGKVPSQLLLERIVIAEQLSYAPSLDLASAKRRAGARNGTQSKLTPAQLVLRRTDLQHKNTLTRLRTAEKQTGDKVVRAEIARSRRTLHTAAKVRRLRRGRKVYSSNIIE